MPKQGRNLIVLAAAAGLTLASGDSTAVRQPDHLAGLPGFQAADGSRVRADVDIRWHAPPPAARRAFGAFQHEVGSTWQASWDRATGVPSRMFGPGVHVPGSVASASVAGAFAHQFLARHIDLLAPGASANDFVLAGNHEADGMRTVGFFQYYRGLRVLGGQVSFRFKNDRMFVIGSEALPRVGGKTEPARTDPEAALSAARSWIMSDVAGSTELGDVSGPYILPLVGDTRVLTYRTVLRATIHASDPVSRWDVYIDAYDGHPVAREQTLHFADGTLLYNAPIRRPTGERQDYAVDGASVTIGGAAVTSGPGGAVSWPGTGTASITLRASGPLVETKNEAGAALTESLTIAPGADLEWNVGSNELADAQVTAFVHARLVQEYVRGFAPDLELLGERLPVTVNIDDSCNAFSDGFSINFFQSSQQCENTARLADVVYHEFGHSMHSNSIIPGAGRFDGAFSEGLSDYLAATIQNDAGMGRGFFYDNSALRELDPVDSENVWPDDIGEIHTTGIIFGGAMWDLRKALVATYGDDAGVELADRLFYAAVQRASNIPTTYVEILAADDDNGDLTDGTPNECTINAAFGAHGLRALSAEISPLAVETPTQAGWDVSVRVQGLATERCPGDGVASATLAHRPRLSTENPDPTDMVVAGDTYTGTIPEYAAGQVVSYQIEITFLDGSKRTFPDNPGDPWYEFYIGEVEELFCTNFDDQDPFANGWSHELASGEMRDGADDWMWGTPLGIAGSGDPAAAYSGDKVIGNDLGGGDFNGSYQANKVNFALSPTIDVGNYSDVRLQYRRWLNVEDSFFDKGTIYANDQIAWRNFNSDQGNSSSTHHQDSEWRFHDVPLSQHIAHGEVQIKFEIDSDGGLEMGGWTIDDFCIVAANGSICGDGNVSGAEQCDDGAGNSNSDADSCRTNCRVPTCGDGVVDSGETCDDGNSVNDDECNNLCDGAGPSADGDGGGCGCQHGRNLPPAGGVLLLFGVAVAVLRRRRSRA